MKPRWLPGNQVELLENGEAFFPAVFDAIRAAEREVLVETFIVFEDKVGLELHEVLVGAARRGVQVDLLVDGFGSADLTPAYVGALTEAGVRVRTFDPTLRLFGQRLGVLRRMHRKITVVDGKRAFVGGINFSADHLADFGPQAKEDFAVELQGPIVGVIRRFARAAIRAPGGGRGFWNRVSEAQPPSPRVGTAEALFVTRDNLEHRTDIERHYRAAIRTARKRILIANAYFFPGYRLLRQLRRAARRGVDVRLILQGEPDVPLARTAATMLYEHLQRDGVRIFEYCERPLHGKVAVIDDEWATVGSSNLDPLSLSLNLEANVFLRDAGFAATLAGRLEALMASACKEIDALGQPPRWPLWAHLRSTVVFHFLRHFPTWADLLPTHAPRLATPAEEAAAAASQAAQGGAEVVGEATPPPAEPATGGAHAR